MPLLTIAQQMGVFGQADLDLLSRVYLQAAFLTNTEEERANCARAAIALFRSGVTDEETLIRLASQQLDVSQSGEHALHFDHLKMIRDGSAK